MKHLAPNRIFGQSSVNLGMPNSIYFGRSAINYANGSTLVNRINDRTVYDLEGIFYPLFQLIRPQVIKPYFW